MIRSFHGLFSRCRIIQQKYIAYPGAVACGWSSSPGIVIKLLWILVQKLKDNCNESINLGHTVTITLERVCDWYGKGKCIQMEALSA